MSDRICSYRLPAEAASVPEARGKVRALLVEWNLQHLADDACLVVSELMTNAIRHTGRTEDGHLELTAGQGDHDRFFVEVADGCTGTLPQQRSPGPDDSGGRGLLLVQRLSDDWGVRTCGTGKVVWAQLRTSGGGAPAC
ncbi:ATP-binding protein [Streptomyces sodiiphilus]